MAKTVTAPTGSEKISNEVIIDAMEDLAGFIHDEIDHIRQAYLEHEESLKVSMSISFGEGKNGFEVEPFLSFSKGKIQRKTKKVYDAQMKLFEVE